jgi:hypothetical protein
MAGLKLAHLFEYLSVLEFPEGAVDPATDAIRPAQSHLPGNVLVAGLNHPLATLVLREVAIEDQGGQDLPGGVAEAQPLAGPVEFYEQQLLRFPGRFWQALIRLLPFFSLRGKQRSQS